MNDDENGDDEKTFNHTGTGADDVALQEPIGPAPYDPNYNHDW